MENTTHYSRTRALTAIAAALALSSTPVFAQQAQPTPADPPTPVAAQPAPVTDTVPTAPVTTTSAAPLTEPSADVATSAKTTAPTRGDHVKRTSKVTARTISKPALARATTHVTAHRTAMSTTVTPSPKPAAAPVAPAESRPSTLTAAASPARQAQHGSARPTTKPAKHDNTVPIAAGGVLALLAIGGAAVAINRRRPEDEEEWTEEYSGANDPQMSKTAARPEPEVPAVDEQAPIVAPPLSAFPWNGSEQGHANVSEEPQVEKDDRQPGESWVQRAYRGPSPLNPSVSLKTRLKRAAFFDKRERDAAAGLAKPVDPTAGLPERMVEENQHQQSSEFA